MKWSMAMSIVLTFANVVLARDMSAVVHARRHGADTRIEVTVVHEDGSTVAGARVRGFFPSVFPKEAAKTRIIEKRTDVNGQATLQEMSGGDVFIRVSKEGYYESREVVKFCTGNPSCVNEGRWQPWGYPCKIVLKPKLYPRKLVSSFVLDRVIILFPTGKNERVGFDLNRCDWVAPDGQGVVTDLLISCRWRTEGLPENIELRREVVFEFPHEKDGAYRVPLSTQSYLQTPHKADLNATYEKRFLFWRDISFSPKAQQENLNTECLILRTRTKCDEAGNILSAHYTKILEPPVINAHEEAEVQLFYFYNPTPNDPWLESDFDARIDGRHLRGAKRW